MKLAFGRAGLIALSLTLGGCSAAGSTIENEDFGDIMMEDAFGARCVDETCNELVNLAAARPEV